MRSEEEIRNYNDEWRELKEKALAQDDMTTAREAALVVTELKWVLEEE